MIDSVINKCPVISIIYDKNLYEPTNSAIHFKTMIESDIYTLMDDLRYLEDGIEKIQSNKTLFENKRNEFIQSFVRPVNLNIEVGEIVRKEIEGLV